MTDSKYVAFDVHQATISAAVLDESGKLLTQAVLQTDAAAIRDFLRGISGKLTGSLNWLDPWSLNCSSAIRARTIR